MSFYGILPDSDADSLRRENRRKRKRTNSICRNGFENRDFC